MYQRKFFLAAVLGLAIAGNAVAAQPLGSQWSDVSELPDFFTGSWQSVTSMLDHPTDTPYTDQAKAYIAHYKPIEDIAFAGASCKTPGMPIVLRAGSPLKFFFEPGMIAIYIEEDSMTRFIKLNARHSARPDPTYLGESIAHFEGDTLVVDSTGFTDDIVFQYGVIPGRPVSDAPVFRNNIFGPHGKNMRMVERIRLLDPDTLEDRLTIYDDTVWKKPYVVNPVQIFKRNRGENSFPREWVCGSASLDAFDPAKNKTSDNDASELLKEVQQSEAQ